MKQRLSPFIVSPLWIENDIERGKALRKERFILCGWCNQKTVMYVTASPCINMTSRWVPGAHYSPEQRKYRAENRKRRRVGCITWPKLRMLRIMHSGTWTNWKTIVYVIINHIFVSLCSFSRPTEPLVCPESPCCSPADRQTESHNRQGMGVKGRAGRNGSGVGRWPETIVWHHTSFWTVLHWGMKGKSRGGWGRRTTGELDSYPVNDYKMGHLSLQL